MVFYAHGLQEALDSPTIVVLTDRNDLDDQLFGQFAKCKNDIMANNADPDALYFLILTLPIQSTPDDPPG